MSKDDERPGAEDKGKGKIADASALPRHLGTKLRSMFTDVEGQPIPERLRKLLEELAEKEKKSE